MPPEHGSAPVVSRRGLRLTGVVLVLIAAVVVGDRHHDAPDGRRAAERMDRDPGDPGRRGRHTRTPRGRRTTIDLPGRLEAYSQAQLYARVSGYMKEWKADIGTPVKAGQVLAEIEAPDLDQQIMQAEADRRERAGQCRARAARPCSAGNR